MRKFGSRSVGSEEAACEEEEYGSGEDGGAGRDGPGSNGDVVWEEGEGGRAGEW